MHACLKSGGDDDDNACLHDAADVAQLVDSSYHTKNITVFSLKDVLMLP